jgi:hypothetical protein
VPPKFREPQDLFQFLISWQSSPPDIKKIETISEMTKSIDELSKMIKDSATKICISCTRNVLKTKTNISHGYNRIAPYAHIETERPSSKAWIITIARQIWREDHHTTQCTHPFKKPPKRLLFLTCRPRPGEHCEPTNAKSLPGPQ